MNKIDFTDAGFLYLESREAPMHVGGLSLFEYPERVNQQKFMARIGDAYCSTTRLRSPFGDCATPGILGNFGPLFWEPDKELDLDYHVRHSALPKPGRYRELFALVSRLHATLLDRSRPLWEIHLIEGLQDRQFAVYSKFHHATIDGIAGVRMTESVCSTDPEASCGLSPLSVEAFENLRGTGRNVLKFPPVPNECELKNLAEFVAQQFDTSIHILSVLRNYVATWLGAGGGLAVPWRHVPRTRINGRISGSRRFVAQSWSIDRVKAVGKAVDATLNDIVLAMCSGALRRYLLEQDDFPGHSLRALVPVSVRVENDYESANAISYITANLGTKYSDPKDRLAVIMDSTRAGKKMLGELTAREATIYAGLTQLPLVVSSLLGVADWFPAFSTVISNVPGPREQLYWNGAPMLGFYPVSAVFHGIALNITFISYNGNLDFGIVACRRSVPHVQRLIGYLETALVELEEMAGLGK